jgi:hypothetical protein
VSAGQWAFWLAVAALIAGAGKFIDDYHVKSTTKSRIRDVLVRWFIWLDDRKIPDLGGFVLKLISRLLSAKRLLLLAFGFVATYWATLTCFYLVRQNLGPPTNDSYVMYILKWLPLDRSSLYWLTYLTLIALPSLIGLVTTAHFLHRASIARGNRQMVWLLVSGFFAGIALALSGGFAALLIFGPGGYGIFVIVVGLGSLIVPSALTACVLALMIIRSGITLVRHLLLVLFDVASSHSLAFLYY